jgi:DNA-3-methyladenine glycosylase II
MPTRSFDIVPQGPFSFDRARDLVATFPPLGRHHAASDARRLRLAFNLDGDHRPAFATLTWNGTAVLGRTDGPVEAVRAQVARILSLDYDASDYPDVALRAPEIAPLMARFDGLRPACFTSPYECAAWAIVSQRISKHQAAMITARIVGEHGHPSTDGASRAFPTPERLLAVRSVKSLPPVKIARLHAVARAAQAGLLDARRLRALGDDAGPASVRVIDGIGPFWASGIYLRACGIRDVFPDEPLAMAAVRAIGGSPERYAPWRMWVCFLLRVAQARGALHAA